MARPRNATNNATIQTHITQNVMGWLEELAQFGVYGKTPSAVANHFILAGVANELRPDGLLLKGVQDTSKISITNVSGVTILGDHNIVNAEFTDFILALNELDERIGEQDALTDAEKQDARGDLATIRTQFGKVHPDTGILRAVWRRLMDLSSIAALSESVYKVGRFISGWIG